MTALLILTFLVQHDSQRFQSFRYSQIVALPHLDAIGGQRDVGVDEPDTRRHQRGVDDGGRLRFAQRPAARRRRVETGQFVEVDWDRAIKYVASTLSHYKGNQFAAMSSAKCTNEENYFFQKGVQKKN